MCIVIEQMCASAVNKKYVKTETLTVIRTEEVSVVDENMPEATLPKKQLVLGIWRLLIKWILSHKYKWIGDKDDG
tara:strand:+ start:4013 stop:4237 length:225 start_codon:yes stop_codon:yes gene_type:complete